MRIYTRKGDDGTTGLLFGGRVKKNDKGPEAYGTVDEAVAALGVARASATEPAASVILGLQRGLFVAGAELATAPQQRGKLVDGVSRVTQKMIDDLEQAIDEVAADIGMPTEFIVPGGSVVSATLDLARTVVRRAERRSIDVAAEHSLVIPYLNRLADYLYMLARAAETAWVPSREDGAP